MLKKHIVIYHEWIPKVGGIESAVYNLAKLLFLKGYKVTIAFLGCESQIHMLGYGDYADVIRIGEEEIPCDVCIMATNHNIPHQIKANKHLQWIHSDYEKYKLDLRNQDRIDQYVAVSKHAKAVAKRLFGVEAKVIYNLLDEDFGKKNGKKVLRLVTNSRISPEKGFARMVKLAERLRDLVRLSWVVYGDNSHSKSYEDQVKQMFSHIEEVSFVGYKQDITIGLTNADFLVMLSDFEGCPYAVLEALSLNVPCILTDYPGARELVKDGETGYIVPMDIDKLTDAKLKQIVEKRPNFVYKPLSKIEEWEKLI